MADSPPESQHCYSARLLRPFGRLLRTYPGMPEELVAPIEALDPDSRIPIATTHELLAGAMEITKDPYIGLKAAGMIEPGDYGAVEYAAASANTAWEALETIGRYLHLINDALTFSMEVGGERAFARLESAVVLPPAAECFQVGAFLEAFRHRAPQATLEAPFEVHFCHPEPADLSSYVALFTERADLRFRQPMCGFAFSAELLNEPLDSSDPHLHKLVSKLADAMLSELPRADSFTSRVRELITEGLPTGRASYSLIAGALHVSERTLARRLAAEGTSFKELMDQIRRQLALRYVEHTDLAFSEVAFLLGFSQTAAFYRAFKRWTDSTPLEVRRARRG